MNHSAALLLEVRAVLVDCAAHVEHEFEDDCLNAPRPDECRACRLDALLEALRIKLTTPEDA